MGATASRNGPNLLVQVVDPVRAGAGRSQAAHHGGASHPQRHPQAPRRPHRPTAYSVRATVQIVDWDRVGDDPLFTARTSADGNDTGRFRTEQFRSSSAEVQGPDLIVRVFNAEGLLLATSLNEGALGAGFPHNSGSPKTIMIKSANKSFMPQ